MILAVRATSKQEKASHQPEVLCKLKRAQEVHITQFTVRMSLPPVQSTLLTIIETFATEVALGVISSDMSMHFYFCIGRLLDRETSASGLHSRHGQVQDEGHP